ncbi:MAG: iron chelate uptake ABC transporter family permease subunit [Oscillospiraceae bacterium]|nr:iron chelate uptake ABC transporter family permease subunit [Oscillospiraceae bacterium]
MKSDSEGMIRLRRTADGAEEERAGASGKRLPLPAILAAALFFLFCASLLFAVPYRDFVYSPAWVFVSVRRRMEELHRFLFAGGSPFGATFWQMLAVILAGAALSACGASLKGSFRNAMAGPSTMGVMAGGSLGTLLYLLLFVPGGTSGATGAFDAAAYASRSFFQLYGRPFFTLAGCFLGVALILGVAFAAGRGRLSAPAMIVSGTVFSILIQNLSAIIQYFMIVKDPADPRIQAIRDLMMGSFSGISSGRTLLLLGVPILLGLSLLLILSPRMDLLSLDEAEAISLGFPIQRYRLALVAVSTLLTAVTMSFCGHIGMLGFMAPLLGRRLAGPGLRRQLPVDLLLGAILLLLIFDAATVAGLSDYLNLFTSGIGCVVMLGMLLLKKEGSK